MGVVHLVQNEHSLAFGYFKEAMQRLRQQCLDNTANTAEQQHQRSLPTSTVVEEHPTLPTMPPNALLSHMPMHDFVSSNDEVNNNSPCYIFTSAIVLPDTVAANLEGTAPLLQIYTATVSFNMALLYGSCAVQQGSDAPHLRERAHAIYKQVLRCLSTGVFSPSIESENRIDRSADMDVAVSSAPPPPDPELRPLVAACLQLRVATLNNILVMYHQSIDPPILQHGAEVLSHLLLTQRPLLAEMFTGEILDEMYLNVLYCHAYISGQLSSSSA